MNIFWKKSIALHLVFLIPIVLSTVFKKKEVRLDTVEFKVIEKKLEPLKEKIIKEVKEINAIEQGQKKAAPVSSKPVKKVFGLQKNTLTTEGNDATAVSIKKGNTILKEVDNEILENEDPLPVPVAEYTVSSMPVLLNEIIPKYPKEAKDNNFETSVAVVILIDKNGLVRRADLVEDPGFGTGKAALDAVRKYKFKPAKIGNKNVPIEIRYYVEFKLY